MPDPAAIKTDLSLLPAAFYLEMQTDHIFSYVRNDRPFLLIPYEYEGAQHHFEPDYVVRLRSGQTLILEMKGEEDEQDRQKYQAAPASRRTGSKFTR